MLHASTQQLIRKLCELTEANAIAWKEGERQSSVFETEGYKVEIEADPPCVRLLRLDGRELERADAADLAAPWEDGNGTYATHVVKMATRAHRVARGAEDAISKILSSLSAPPKKAPEPEPEPAALAFEPPAQKPAHIPAAESAAAIAAVNADLESQRRRAPVEDKAPPVSHTTPPAPLPAEISPETETAIDRVLAVQPHPHIDPAPPVIAPAPEPVITPPPRADAAPDIWTNAAAQPTPAAEPPPPPAPEPERELPAAPVIVASAPQPPPAPVMAAPVPRPAPAQPAARPGFGAIDSFSRAQAAPAPQAPSAPPTDPPKITSSGLLVSGFSARTRQLPESSSASDFRRPAPPAAPAPAPAAEKKLEPVAATGADIYKPWS